MTTPDGSVKVSLLLAMLFATTFMVLPSFGADTANPGVVSLVVENDIFSNADRHYTSGIRLDLVPGTGPTPERVLAAARQIPLFPEEGVVRHGYSLGQSMFTPRDLTLVDPPINDRPYAGWLYGSIGLGAESDHQLDQIVLTLGVVGPAAMAEQSQKALHTLIPADEPRGWDSQLKNEPGIVLTYQRSWRAVAVKTLAGEDLDLTPHAGVALGNVFTYANTGFTVRYGSNLPHDYGPPRIQPGLPGSSTFSPANSYTWYLFAGIEGRAVARNIFLDGNTFRSSRSVDKEPFVGDLQFGFVLLWHDYRFSYTHVLRTDEFKSQDENDGFGAISLSVLYR